MATLNQNGIIFTLNADVVSPFGGKYTNDQNFNDNTGLYNDNQNKLNNLGVFKSVNAVEIDWNGAKPGIGEGTNGITSTGELLSTLKNYIDSQSGYTTYSAGTGLSLSGTTINHSNSITAKSSGLYKIAFDAQGHITSATAVTVDDLRELVTVDYLREILDPVYELKSNPATLSSIAWKTTTGTSSVGTTVNTSVITNKITCTWSDNTTTEVNETGFNVYTNSACTSAASNDWYNTAGTYYIKGTYSGKTTDNYITWTISKVTPTLTINNPASTTIADGGTTTIAITSSVPGLLRFSSNDSTAAGSDGTAWKANITPTSTAATSFTITVTNNTAVTEQSTISTNGIKVTFTPSDTTNYNTVSEANAIRQQITLSAAQQSTSYYWYVGTTKPTSLSQATTVTSYPTEQTYTNNSGEKSHIFVLTNNDKNVTFINPELNSPVSQVTVDTTTIPGYNIFETAVGTANGRSIKIQIS